MSGAFKYKPKFVDIRVRPPKDGEDDASREDVTALKPGERPCDHPGCRLAGANRAPKSRHLPGEHYWFCFSHAAEYNRSWDYFAGMSERELRDQLERSAAGDRPTWSFEASRHSREAAAARSGERRQFNDPFGLFAAARRRAEQAEAEAARKLGKIERNALADLDLDATAKPETIRARYIELVKRCHPDSNGGDRSAETKLARVIKAYQALRKAKMA
jgi:curved DNA-binding protein CbpA